MMLLKHYLHHQIRQCGTKQNIMKGITASRSCLNLFQQHFSQIINTTLVFADDLLTLTSRQASADNVSKYHKHVNKNDKKVEFHYNIWNHHEKCI